MRVKKKVESKFNKKKVIGTMIWRYEVIMESNYGKSSRIASTVYQYFVFSFGCKQHMK